MGINSERKIRLNVIARDGKELSCVYDERELAFRMVGLTKMTPCPSWWLSKP